MKYFSLGLNNSLVAMSTQHWLLYIKTLQKQLQREQRRCKLPSRYVHSDINKNTQFNSSYTLKHELICKTLTLLNSQENILFFPSYS